MDFNFSEDQQQLREAAHRWVEKGYSFERRRSIVEEGGFSQAAWQELAELGLPALTVNEAHGGLAQSDVDAMIAMEEMGRGLVLEPLAQSFIASKVLQTYAPEAVQAQWLPRLASGEAVITLAYQERKARYRIDVCEAQATKNATSIAVTASKNMVLAGGAATAYLVPAQYQGQMALFLVERQADGVRTQTYRTQDGAQAADVFLNEAPATLVTLQGEEALALAVDTGIACLCAEAVGVMDQTLSLTADYMNQRRQFGVAIASFQALRHRVADMKMQLELARSMSYYATLKLSAPAQERRLALARAKVQLGQSMRFIGQQSVQLHGGIGVTDEYIGSHYFKRLTQMEMTFGDTLHHLGEVSARMQETAGVFA